MPIIRIEVDHMRQAMLHAFGEHQLQLDAQFKAAIEHACQPEKVQAILNEAAERYIKQAMEDEVKNYLLYGPGRKLIAAEVAKKLSEET